MTVQNRRFALFPEVTRLSHQLGSVRLPNTQCYSWDPTTWTQLSGTVPTGLIASALAAPAVLIATAGLPQRCWLSRWLRPDPRPGQRHWSTD
jgi:hypothetical protein